MTEDLERCKDENTIFRDRGPFIALLADVLARKPSRQFMAMVLRRVIKLARKLGACVCSWLCGCD